MNTRVVITGPESTGKSSIVAALAEEFKLPFAPEYARIYLEEHGPEYDFDLLLAMSEAHKEFQDQHVPPDAVLGLLDTDLINYKIWCEVVYGKCHPEICRGVEEEKNHVYLLCYPDLDWAEDPLRENPDNLDELYERHLAEIQRLNRPYEIIRGKGSVRFTRASTAFRSMLEQRGLRVPGDAHQVRAEGSGKHP